MLLKSVCFICYSNQKPASVNTSSLTNKKGLLSVKYGPLKNSKGQLKRNGKLKNSPTSDFWENLIW